MSPIVPDAGIGTLQDFDHAPNAAIKLMRVTETSAKTRSTIARDPAVREVHPVYYLKGSSAPIAASGTLNVRFRPGVSARDRDQLLSDMPLQVVEVIPGLKNTYTLRPIDADEFARVFVKDFLLA